MPIRFSEPGAPVAAAIRSRLQSLQAGPPSALHALAGAAPAELTLEAPHEVYNLGLDQLTAGGGVADADLSGWRYLLRRGDTAVASAQTAVSADGVPVFSMFNSGPFVAATQQALDQADAAGGAADGPAVEPRLLHVPALHAMALWLHGEDGADDVLMPLRPAPPTIDPSRTYTVDEYLDALRRAARRVDAVGPEDTTGG